VVNITGPANGAAFTADAGAGMAAVSFSATAADAEDGDVSATLIWRDENGANLGSGALVTANLAVGAHTVTASVADSSGAAGSVSISVTVNPPPVQETMAVTKANWRQKNKSWTIEGTGSVAGNTINLYLNGDTSRLIGTAAVDAAGVWRFSGKSAVNPAAGETVVAVSSGQAAAAPFPVTIN
jgi:hypothetical protein